MPRGQKLTPEEKRERRQKVIQVASQYFANQGIEPTTMWQIREGLQEFDLALADTQIYGLFDNHGKAGIAIALFKEAWDKINAITEEEIANPNTNARQKLLLVYQQTVALLHDNPIGTVLIMESRQAKLGREFVKTGLDRFAHLLDEIIQTGQQKGIFRSDLNPQAIRQQVIGCGDNALLGWIWKKRVPSYTADYTLDDACRVFEALLDGISIR